MRGGLRGKSFLPVSELEDHGNGRGRAEVHITHRSVTAPGNHHPCLSLCLSRTTGPTQESRGSRANLVSFYLHTADPKSYLPAKKYFFCISRRFSRLGGSAQPSCHSHCGPLAGPKSLPVTVPTQPASPGATLRESYHDSTTAGLRPAGHHWQAQLELELENLFAQIKREHARREGTRP